MARPGHPWCGLAWARTLLLVTAALPAPVWGQSTIAPPEPAPPPRLVLRVAVGASYLHERWDPHDGGPPAVTSGFGPSVEVAIGRRLSSRLVVGGAWQTMAVIDPEQTYLGTRYELTSVVKAIDALSVFGDYVVVPRFHCRLGLALGGAATSIWDRYVNASATSWGLAVAPYAAYDRPLGRAWSAGVVARMLLYRSSFGEAPSSASRLGIVPALSLQIGFR